MFSCFLVSDPSEILVDWAKLSIDIDVQEGDTWFLRAVKQDLGQTFRRGGHIEVDDITVLICRPRKIIAVFPYCT